MGLTFALYATAAPLAVEEVKPNGMFPFLEAAYPVEVEFKFYNPPRWTWSSCVDTVKYALRGEVNDVWGRADRIQAIEGLKPARGAIVLLNEGRYGHIALITSTSSKSMELLEGNYIPNRLSTRSMDFDNPNIRGYTIK